MNKIAKASGGGREWIFILDNKEWFHKRSEGGFPRIGKNKSLLPQEEKIFEARRLIVLNLTKIKKEVSGRLN